MNAGTFASFSRNFSFSSGGCPGSEKKSNDYESGFENLMQKGKVSEKVSQEFQKRREDM